MPVVAGQGVRVIWGRSGPGGTGLVIGAARVAYDTIGFGYAPLPLGPAIAVYTVIDRRGPVLRWITMVLVAVGITVSEASPGHNEPYDAIFQALIFLTALAARRLRRPQPAHLQAAQRPAHPPR